MDKACISGLLRGYPQTYAASFGGEENGRYLCAISDDGVGIAPEGLKALNRGDGIASTQGSDEKVEHGLGLKLVVQIVKAHRGTISFSGNTPHGLEVRISLPPQPLIS